MGVDISTYRSRIGTFRHGPGLDVILIRVCVNYSGGLQMVGALTFIGMLLIMAGVETNPGPLDKPAVSLEEGEMSADKMLDIGKTTGRASHRVSPARQTSTSGQTVSVNSSGLQTGTTVNNTNISLSDQDQPLDPPVVQEASTATINPDASVPTMSSAQDTPLGNNQTTPSPPGEMSADKMLDIGKTTGRASHRVSPARQTSTSGQTLSVNSSGLQTGTTVTNTNISLSDQDQPVDPLVVQEASTATINPDVSVPTMSSAQDTPLGNNQTTPSPPGYMTTVFNM